MKKIFAVCFAVMLALTTLPALASAETVVTSFYPIYLLALNLTQGVDGVEVHNLAAPGTGCLHDYQLQTGDMKALAGADVFLVNGAGMESYLAHVYDAFPNLPVVEAAAGITLIGDDEMPVAIGEEESEANAHIWLDAKNAMAMTVNLCEGLSTAMPEKREAFEQNRDAYLERLTALDAELTEGLSNLAHREIITFHEAFPYFAKAYGLKVVAVVNREPGEALSPARLSELVKLVKSLGAPPLFVEPQYEDIAAKTLAAETGAEVYTLDPVVTGPETGEETLTYYEEKMRENMRILQTALNVQ